MKLSDILARKDVEKCFGHPCSYSDLREKADNSSMHAYRMSGQRILDTAPDAVQQAHKDAGSAHKYAMKSHQKAAQKAPTPALAAYHKAKAREHEQAAEGEKPGGNNEEPGSVEAYDTGSADYAQMTVGMSPIPHDHAPSLRNPIRTKKPLAQDGWKKGDSPMAKKLAKSDMAEVFKRVRRQIGKPEIAQTANQPVYPVLHNMTYAVGNEKEKRG